MYFGCGLSDANNITTRLLKEYGRNHTEPNFRSQLKYLRDLNAAGLLDPSGQFNPADNISVAAKKYGVDVDQETRDFFFYSKGKGGFKQDALLYGSRQTGLTFYLFKCSMKSIMVEANIVCEAKNCGAERLRRLDMPRSKRYGTSLPYDIINNGMYMPVFLQYLTGIGGDNSQFRSNPVDAYIYGNTPWATIGGSSAGPMNNWTEYFFDTQRSTGMSQQLSRVLNTYWDASRWPLAMTRNDPFGTASINKTTGEPFEGMTMNKTEAVVTHQIPIYRASTGWVACLVTCFSVLLLLGICSLILSFSTTAPDIFDYVSSFIRDNPYVDAPPGGSSLDGAEHARLLRKLPVQLGDADASAEVGYIAMRSVSGRKDCKEGRVRRVRTYR